MSAQFLLRKARHFAEIKDTIAFEDVFALLAYGLFLYPNVDKFVDINAIRIFLIGNPVPTLLGDTYYSIHLRNSYQGGRIICCAPLLYQWYVSHLPGSDVFWDLEKEPRWAPKIMALTHFDIDWYNRVYYNVKIIDSCGAFPNVPLLGTKGGINYNPVLARRQFGYPMRDKPNNIHVSGFFLQEGQDHQAAKREIEGAWRHIHRKGRDMLGHRGAVSLEPYLQWVRARACALKMPYKLEKPLFPTVASSSVVIPIANIGEYQGNLARMKSERDAWKEKYNMSEYENRVLTRQLKEKEELLFIQDGWFIDHDEKLRQKDALLKRYASERKRKKEGSVSVALVPNPQKEIIDRLVAEKKEMEDFYEEKIKKLRLQLVFGPSSDVSE